MEVLFLGSGPAKNIRRKNEVRTNSSIMIDSILIDCTPNFLEQIKKNKITDISKVILTHAHKDAIGGLSDLNKWVKKPIEVYSTPRVLANRRLKKRWKNLIFKSIMPYQKTKIDNLNITPFKVIHAEIFWKDQSPERQFPCYGFRIDNLVYAEDMESIPKNSEKYFRNAKIIIADAAMYFGKQIRGHMNVAQSLEIAKQFKPESYILMQAGRTYPKQKEAEKEIKKYVEKNGIDFDIFLAYDGMKLKEDKIEILFEIEDTEELIELQAFGSSGGKSRVASKLVSLIPEHDIYLEPFAGGAAVYWKKEPVNTEILNDKNSEIAFAYKFIRDCTEEQINKLKQMNWTPNKTTFFRLRDSSPPQDSVQRFYRFYYVHAYSYGLSSKTYGYKTKKVGILNRIPKLKERLKNTKIYNMDYSKILEQYNSKNSFAYLDPPYPQEWAGPEGTKIFTKEDTQKLHDLLKNFKGKFLLSINNLDWIKKMFSDFKIAKLKVPRSFRKGDPPKFELLISNYEIHSLKKNITGVTSSSATAGSEIPVRGLQPFIIKKKKKKKLETKELYVRKRGDQWCVVHSDGSIIKCFPTKVQADKMHKAIIISKIKRGKMQSTEKIENLKPLLNKFEPINLIHDFVSLVGSTVKKEEGHVPNDLDIHLRMGKDIREYLERAIKIRFSKILDKKILEKLHIFSGDAEGSHDTFIPLYHLALIPADKKIIEMESKKKIELLKPYNPQKPAGSAYYDLNKFMEVLNG